MFAARFGSRRCALVASASLSVALVIATSPGRATASVSVASVADGYESPYEISGADLAFTSDIASRIASYTPGQQSTSTSTTSPAVANWYTQPTYGSAANASWGAAPLTLPRPAVPTSLSTDDVIDFYRQRIVTAASELIGTAYQHHHIPFWNPYANGYTSSPSPNQWPWSAVSSNAVSQQFAPVLTGSTWLMTAGTPFPNPYATQYGTGAAGIDCSDLTSLVYSVAAGIYLDSAVGAQGIVDASGGFSGTSPLGWNNSGVPHLVDPVVPTDPDITPINPAFIIGPNSTYNAANNTRGITTFNPPGSLDGVIAQLKPGDLLYVANTTDPGNKVTHVLIWLGKYGTAVDPATGTVSRVPLVISSHDNTPAVLDANSNLPTLGQGNMPPPGVQVLPFAENNWFYSNFSHAMRAVTTESAYPASPANPVAVLRVVPGVNVVSERVANRTDPRLMLHPPTRMTHAPVVPWTLREPLSLTAPGLRSNAKFDVRIASGKRFTPVGSAASDARGDARLPVLVFTRAGTYTLSIVDRMTGEARFLQILAAQAGTKVWIVKLNG